MKLMRPTLFASLACTIMFSGAAATTVPSAISCPADQSAAFAWWVGAWSYSVPGYDPATITVTASNSGCALQEEFVDTHHQKAHTIIQYDSAGQQWKRSVTDPFRTYTSTGKFAADGSIAFYETATARESYRPSDHNLVHFVGESSVDGGTTWKVLFDATDVRGR